MKTVKLIFAFTCLASLSHAQDQRISFDEFVKEVREGKIEHVELIDPMTILFESKGTEKRNFTFQPYAAVDNPLIIELFEENNVTLTLAPQKKIELPSSFDMFELMFWLLVISMITLFFTIRTNRRLKKLITQQDGI